MREVLKYLEMLDSDCSEEIYEWLKDILSKLYAAGARQHCGILMVCEEIEEVLK